MTNNDLRALAGLVATHLRDWTVEADNGGYGATLVGVEGARLYLHHFKGRIHISGCFPRNPRTGYTYGLTSTGRSGLDPRREITVALATPVARIAKEIERRLLPHYLPAFIDARASMSLDEERHSAALALADELAAILDTDVNPCRSRHSNDTQTLYPTLFPSDNRARVDVYDHGVHMDLTLTPTYAREVARLLVSLSVRHSASRPPTPSEKYRIHAQGSPSDRERGL